MSDQGEKNYYAGGTGIVMPNRNIRRCHAVKVETYVYDDEVCLDYIDFHIDSRARPIRLRPVWQNGQTVLQQIKVFTFGRDANGKSEEIQRVIGENGPVPQELYGIPSTKGGPKGGKG